MGEKKLTEPPKDLKEAIDWITWVCGYGQGAHDMKTKLATAVNSLTDFKTAFKGFLGYDGKGIVASDVDYKSAYHHCNWSADGEPDYAKTFLSLAPLVYYFVTFLYWTCKTSGKWTDKMVSDGGPLDTFLTTMGYDKSQLNHITGINISKELENILNGFDELKEAYESGGLSSYETFLQQLEGNGPTNNINAPLANCKIFSHEYLESKQKDKDITEAIDAIKKELVSLSTRGHSSNTNNFSAIQQKISTLLGKIPGFNPNPASSEPGSASNRHPGSSETGSDGLRKEGSSGTVTASQVQSSSAGPAGPAVGGFVDVGALGAGVAYGLNLGGLQTTINGLLQLR
ncbi:variant erythrocyte surface antigen-1 family protein [Babesia caballi]|uniref:Variant erythrocyte surface antigen-1 family protein n=1 Tax=Babesia caballi TaxID=5871 RepID=A0AAV4LXA6_BABCB|nr:variant erythrocyte surface antigen-1 family protein [Babesia caballi]